MKLAIKPPVKVYATIAKVTETTKSEKRDIKLID